MTGAISEDLDLLTRRCAFWCLLRYGTRRLKFLPHCFRAGILSRSFKGLYWTVKERNDDSKQDGSYVSGSLISGKCPFEVFGVAGVCCER